LVLCVLSYSTYIAAQFYPEFYTLLPTAFLVGLGAAPMWSAKCTYLTQVAHRYAGLDGSNADQIVVKFFGIFFFFFQCNSILGNIISTVVLSSDNDDYIDLTDEEMSKCGSNFCVADSESSKNDSSDDVYKKDNFDIDMTKIYIIAGIYLACSISAAITLAIFVDPLSKFGMTAEKSGKAKLTGIQLLVATFRQMIRKEQLLIIPITFWSGIEQGFFGADFTAGFVTCAYGAHTVGRVLIVYGVCDALGSIGFGYIIKVVGRIPIFIFGACINFTVIAVMLSWTPTNSTLWVVYVLAGLWGIGDAIWQTQINSLYGCLFPNDEEAAFSNYRLWESMGFIFAFITNATGVCVMEKIFCTIAFLVCGMTGYLAVELIVHKKRKQNQISIIE